MALKAISKFEIKCYYEFINFVSFWISLLNVKKNFEKCSYIKQKNYNNDQIYTGHSKLNFSFGFHNQI